MYLRKMTLLCYYTIPRNVHALYNLSMLAILLYVVCCVFLCFAYQVGKLLAGKVPRTELSVLIHYRCNISITRFVSLYSRTRYVLRKVVYRLCTGLYTTYERYKLVITFIKPLTFGICYYADNSYMLTTGKVLSNHMCSTLVPFLCIYVCIPTTSNHKTAANNYITYNVLFTLHMYNFCFCLFTVYVSSTFPGKVQIGFTTHK